MSIDELPATPAELGLEPPDASPLGAPPGPPPALLAAERRTYARVQGGVVVEVIRIEAGTAAIEARYHPDLVAALRDAPADVAPGWRLAVDEAGGVSWHAAAAEPPPAPLPAAIRRISALSFRTRLDMEALGRVTLAASRAMEAGDPTLQVFLDNLSAARWVDLDDPMARAGVALLLSAGLVDEAEAAALLADGADGEAA